MAATFRMAPTPRIPAPLKRLHSMSEPRFEVLNSWQPFNKDMPALTWVPSATPASDTPASAPPA
eukprot:4380058-Karenia_brevis.AAC.1